MESTQISSKPNAIEYPELSDIKGRPYERLEGHEDSFRLLCLLPGRNPDRIRCILFESRISVAQRRYSALSYTWGCPEPIHTIEVNNTPFKIRQNLYDFLVTRRHSNHDVILWIDAICIDQDSVNEKNHQVRAMGKIFSCAFEVQCWLGLADESSDWLFEFIRNKGYKGEVDTWDVTPHQSATNWIPGQSFPKLASAWARFMARSFWSRIWIVQELVLANRLVVLCGIQEVCWQKLVSFLGSSRLWDFLGMQSARVSRPLRQLLAAKEEEHYTFEDLFTLFAGRECSIAHDKVYSLLGILQIKSPLQRHLKVDYRCSTANLILDAMDTFRPEMPLNLLQKMFNKFEVEAGEWKYLREREFCFEVERKQPQSDKERDDKNSLSQSNSSRLEYEVRTLQTIFVDSTPFFGEHRVYRLPIEPCAELDIMVMASASSNSAKETRVSPEEVEGRIIAFQGRYHFDTDLAASYDGLKELVKDSRVMIVHTCLNDSKIRIHTTISAAFSFANALSWSGLIGKANAETRKAELEAQQMWSQLESYE